VTAPEVRVFKIPVVEPMIAMNPPLVDHVPPLAALLNVTDVPSHIVAGPVIAGMEATTVTVFVTAPHAAVYVMLAVPVATPVTTPVLLTDAIEEPPSDHVPPAIALLNVVVSPVHTVGMPVIGGTVFTVTAIVLIHPAGCM
jgi:hypothetical protein